MTKKTQLSIHLTEYAAARLDRAVQTSGLGRSHIIEMLMRGMPLEQVERGAGADGETGADDDDDQALTTT